MANITKTMFDAVHKQGYEGAYLPQAIPVLGALVSIPTALVSGMRAIIKLAQAILQGKPYFKPQDAKNMDHVKFPMADAKDLGMIFLNNVANICTLGLLNCIFVVTVSNQFVLNKDFT